jgi:hypothetical protein
MQKLTNKRLLELGFSPIPHFTIQKNHTYALGRGRYISIGDVGTPNEMVWLCQENPNREIEDLVCIHNFDYDGYLTEKKLDALVHGFFTL